MNRWQVHTLDGRLAYSGDRFADACRALDAHPGSRLIRNGRVRPSTLVTLF